MEFVGGAVIRVRRRKLDRLVAAAAA